VGIRVSMDCWRLECGWIIVRVRGCAYSLTVSRRHIFTQKRKVDFYVNLSRIIMFFYFYYHTRYICRSMDHSCSRELKSVKSVKRIIERGR
jgi:hypothetical protein